MQAAEVAGYMKFQLFNCLIMKNSTRIIWIAILLLFISFPFMLNGQSARIGFFNLVDATNDVTIKRLSDPATIYLGEYEVDFNIEAIPEGEDGSEVESVKFLLKNLERGSTQVHVENEAPYLIGGDLNGDYQAWNPGPGRYELTATPYFGNNASGNQGQSLTILLTITKEGIEKEILFGVDEFFDELIRIDPVTAEVSIVGPVGPFASISSLAADRHGTLFGTDINSKNLLTFNLETGAASVVGPTNADQIAGLAFAPDGTLFGAEPRTGQLLTLDPETGLATPVGQTGFERISGLAFSTDGTLYGSTEGGFFGSLSELIRINPTTAEATLIGSMGIDLVTGLTFDKDGRLFGISRGTDDIFTIDLETASISVIGNLGLEERFVGGIEFVKTEEDPNKPDKQIFKVFEDAFTSNAPAQQSVNFGKKNKMFARNKSSWGYESYVKFNVPKPTNKYIQRATLRIYGFNPNNSSPVNVGVFETDDNWTETGITYNNAPPSGSNPIDRKVITDSNEYYEWNVTEYVKGESIKDGTVSIVLKSLNDNYERAQFNTKEKGEFAPELVVVYQKDPDENKEVLFGVDEFFDELIRIDPVTAEVSIVGPVGPFASISSLAADRHGTLFGTDINSKNLLTFNLETGAASVVGPTNADQIAGLAFAPDGTLFGAEPRTGQLLTLDPETGLATPVGQTGFERISGLAFSTDGTLYGSTEGGFFGSLSELIRINPTTAEATLIGSMGIDLVTGLTFDKYGRLFGISRGTDDIFTIDLETASISVIGNLGLEERFVGGIEFVKTEEDPNKPDKQIFKVFEDAFTSNAPAQQSVNFGKENKMFARNKSSWGYESYVKFNVPKPTNKYIQRATLRIYGFNPNNDNPVSVGVFCTDDDWTETGITYNNAPASSSYPIDRKVVSSSRRYHEWDVTEYVTQESLKDETISIVLKSLNDNYERAQFNTKEKGEFAPELVVTYVRGKDAEEILFGVEAEFDNFVRIDPLTANVNIIGPYGPFASISSLAVDKKGVLYATETTSKNLLIINKQTGTATVVGPTGADQITGLSFAPDGTLFGIEEETGRLLILDPETGQTTFVGNTGIRELRPLLLTAAAGYSLLQAPEQTQAPRI